jgi:hypothetical protein
MATPAVLPPNYFFLPHQNVLLQKWKSLMIIRNQKANKTNELLSVYFNFTLQNIFEFLSSVDRASRHMRVMKTNLMHYLSCLFRQSTFTCFGYICSPSSGGILYIYNWYVSCFLVDRLLANSQLRKKHKTYQMLCVCIVYLLMMGYRYVRNMQRLIDEINWV